MKICILGLDCAAPEVILGDDRLANIRRLMELGLYGRLTSVVPPTAVPAWMCMNTSQDPGSLGIYGFRNRCDHSYEKLGIVNSSSIKSFAIWDQLAREGKKSILVGVPPNFPPRRINGISIGCFLTPDPSKEDFTYPSDLKTKLEELVGDYPVDVKDFCTDQKDRLRDEIFAMSRKQWTVVKWLLQEQQWDYFHYVDIGLDRVHHGFWDCFDPQHVRYESGNRYENVIPEYYQWLDTEIGEVLELLDEDTIVLLVSANGAQRLDGGIAVNRWLIEQGLLVLEEYPEEITSFEKLKVNWAKTKAWSDGEYYAQVFFNVQGREPQGIIPPSQYEAFQAEMKSRFEAMRDNKGRSLNSLVFKPEEGYRELHNVAPDLLVQFGDSYWRSVGSVGHPAICVQEHDTEPDGCNHAQEGVFILAAPNCPLNGEYKGAHLLDIAPTVLDLAGYGIPESMQGRSLVAGMEKHPLGASPDNEQIIFDRLAGLGYV